MESTYQRLAVLFKLRRGLDAELASQTDYFRTLSLLGQAFQDGKEHYTYARLLAYLERKGSMEFFEPVWETARKIAIAGSKTGGNSHTLVGHNRACPTCRRCVACDTLLSTGACQQRHAKRICDCPFPRRMQGWGSVQYHEDLASIDGLERRIAYMLATGKITKTEFDRKHRRCEGMARACRNKLFAIRMRMEEAEQGSVSTDRRRTASGIDRDVAIASLRALGITK